MKKYNWIPLLMAAIFTACTAQKPVTVMPTNYDVSDNLDLEAVASIFGESKNLQDFERRLNDPKARISNLDLNEDGYVDYLRVIETVERGTHLVTIQATLGNDLFQDVASIDIERDSYNKPSIQFIGHPYFYGPHYIIEPVYYHSPIFIDTFWGPAYVVYHSPYYWNYYPSYYSYWRPYPVHRYVTHVHVYKNVKNTYKYVPTRRSATATALIRDNRRNDYVVKKPNATFETRNKDVQNKRDLETRRNITGTDRTRTTPTQRPDARTTTPRTEPRDSSPRPSTTPNTRNPAPSERNPTTSPRTEPRNPATTPNTRRPASTPSTTPSERKSTKKSSRRSDRK